MNTNNTPDRWLLEDKLRDIKTQITDGQIFTHVVRFINDTNCNDQHVDEALDELYDCLKTLSTMIEDFQRTWLE